MNDETSRAQYVERPMPPGAEQRQWLAIRARREQRGQAGWRWAFGGLAAAAAALVVGVAVLWPPGSAPGEVAAITAAASAHTAVTARRASGSHGP